MRIGWFSTGRDEAARNLLKTVMRKKEQGFFDVGISFVFSNWEEGEEPSHPDFAMREMFYDLVRGYGIPLVSLSWKKFMPVLKKQDREKWRTEYGKEMRERIKPYPFDLGVLAGYMLWMDNESCQTFNLINLHPALPGGPKGTWQDVVWKLIEVKADRQGAMIHLCTPDWDEGPPLTYCGFSLSTRKYNKLWAWMDLKLRTKTLEQIKTEEGENEPLFMQMRKDGEIRELPLIAYSIKLFADGKVEIRNDKLYENGKLLGKPYDLSKPIDEAVKKREFKG
ncbi:MAG: formyltransferase family protein [Methanomassiliicoccales archaeon]